MSENKEKLTRIRAVRGGNRGVITKLINEVEGLLREEVLERGRLNTITNLLEEKLKLVKDLDQKIIEICEVVDIEDEIAEAEELISKVLDTQRHIFEKIHETEEVQRFKEVQGKSSDDVHTNSANKEPVQQQQHSEESVLDNSASTSNNNTSDTQSLAPSPPDTAESTGTVSNQQNSINYSNNNVPVLTQNRTKLPKLVLPKYRGDVTQWRTFWDSFNSAIHTNSYLTKIDKFNHLNSLLEGQALRAIQGLTLSENNYQTAIDVLHQRFGKTQHIISTHMDELLKIPACTTDKTSQLRFIYDKISINVRGLEALGVNSSQYGSLLIPVVMSKLPQDVRLQIARNTAQDVWEISELLSVIQREVEAREISDGIKVNPEKIKISHAKPLPHGSATALLANGPTPENRIQCVYCSGNHFSASCTKTNEVHARLEILKRDRRCFVCLKKGHRSNQCSNQKGCRRCNGRHHQSICNQQIPTMKPNVQESAAPTRRNESGQASQTSQQIQDQTENSNPNTHTVHVQSTTATTSTKGQVILQTATALATNEDGSKSAKVKLLFDSGSQRSYITEGLKSRLNIKPKKTETLHLNTFGERSYRKQKCEVSPFLLRTNKNEDVMISALSFPVICSPLTAKIEVDQYPHLQGLQLADSSDSNDSIDVLIGSDHYWDLVKGNTVRGEFGPVAIDSMFGWLLSGPTNNGADNEICTANLTILGSSDSQSETMQDPLVDILKTFWETESIGIKGDPEPKDIIESFNESVHFNGTRYEVDLPWNQDCPSIPSDYQLC